MILRYPATAADYQKLARRKLPRFLADYLDGGAGEELTLSANNKGWQAIPLRQRVMIDVDRVDTSTTLAGQPSDMPVALAPLGLAGMMATRGEVQAMRAATAHNLPFTLSTVGICSLAEVNQATPSACWFQLYMLRDREFVKALLEQAWQDGCKTLIFTVDLPLPGPRHRDTRNGLNSAGARSLALKAQQLITRPGWLWHVAKNGKPLTFGNLSNALPAATDLDAFKHWIDTQFDASATWRDIEWLRHLWPGALILKGILDADDARAAVNAGADGLVVSNHGGRQLDGVAATALKLPEIVAAVGHQTTVLVDGGIRSGIDVFRALALGAEGVMVGRPWAWALAAGGQAALTHMLASWQQELKLAMSLTGVTRIADIGPEHLDFIEPQTVESLENNNE
ncbi:L-lactate dehydrogenase [Marinobacter fuscus]|uniref:L-lactate dehydrogenase n=1 Tax=Marinobacter fuscus TaxID=2109942 RepID=A0A2T1KKK5_9GAMM|nr:L-lactate dehydrogenase [Marinobacter fuscus]PSF10615.1 L-lactate dehydrogenase [Marinobacter fuscus]